MEYRNLVLTAVVVLAAVTSCTAVSLQRRVVGGELTSKGDYPFLISLWYMKENPFTNNTNMHHVCGGALIDPSWVLTAAHCFDARVLPGIDVKESWKVVAGKFNQVADEDSDQFRTITEVHKYKGWNIKKLLGDAALLKLNEPVDLSREDVSVIKPDTDPSCAVAGADCYVVGWGQVTEEPYGYGMYIPVVAEMPVVDTETCKEAMKPENVENRTIAIDDSLVCAGHVEGEVDACSGDSGGPLVCVCDVAEVVSGIVSHGHGCARENLYGIYTRVSLLKDWIDDVIGGRDQAGQPHTDKIQV
ncbi:trypsin-like [Haliotis asinina]|uniref:trypsin-like n=1 Tax=Haliotis asinina TaxID=109174 RepID=UPI0035325B67